MNLIGNASIHPGPLPVTYCYPVGQTVVLHLSDIHWRGIEEPLAPDGSTAEWVFERLEVSVHVRLRRLHSVVFLAPGMVEGVPPMPHLPAPPLWAPEAVWVAMVGDVTPVVVLTARRVVVRVAVGWGATPAETWARSGGVLGTTPAEHLWTERGSPTPERFQTPGNTGTTFSSTVKKSPPVFPRWGRPQHPLGSPLSSASAQ